MCLGIYQNAWTSPQKQKEVVVGGTSSLPILGHPPISPKEFKQSWIYNYLIIQKFSKPIPF